MKHRLLRAAGAIALMAILGAFYAVPAKAQVHPMLIKNIDEPGRTPYMDSADCFRNYWQCSNQLKAIPAGKRLVVEHISLNVQTGGNLLQVLVSGNGFDQRLFLQKQVLFSNGVSAYVVSQPFISYYEPGTTPAFEVQINGTSGTGPLYYVEGHLTITGYLIDLTQ